MSNTARLVVPGCCSASRAKASAATWRWPRTSAPAPGFMDDAVVLRLCVAPFGAVDSTQAERLQAGWLSGGPQGSRQHEAHCRPLKVIPRFLHMLRTLVFSLAVLGSTASLAGTDCPHHFAAGHCLHDPVDVLALVCLHGLVSWLREWESCPWLRSFLPFPL